MKRILILVVSLVLLIPLAGFSSSDVQSMSDEELVALNQEIVAELLNRSKKARLNVGWYVVGKDIPAGVYRFEADKSVKEKEEKKGEHYYKPRVIIFKNWEARKLDPEYHKTPYEMISENLESFFYQFVLEEGNILEIDNNAVFIIMHHSVVEFK